MSALLVTVCGERQRRMQWPASKMLCEELHIQKADLGLLQCSGTHTVAECENFEQTLPSTQREEKSAKKLVS